VGDLFHFHPVAPAFSFVRRKVTLVVEAPARVLESPTARSRDDLDLASISLSRDGATADARIDLERCGLVGGDDAALDRDRDFLRDQWLWLP